MCSLGFFSDRQERKVRHVLGTYIISNALAGDALIHSAYIANMKDAKSKLRNQHHLLTNLNPGT